MNSNKSILADLKGINTVIIVGMLLLILLVVIEEDHTTWKEIPEDHHKNILNNYSDYVDPRSTYLLFEYRYKQPDIRMADDNHILIRHHDFILSILCLLYVVSIKRDPDRFYSKKDAWLYIRRYLLIGILYTMFLLIIELVFSWVVGYVFLGLRGFFHPVPVVIHHQLVECPALKYIFITRGLALISLLVICSIGIFIRCMFKKRWLAVSFTTIMIPAMVIGLINLGVDPVFRYRLQDFLFKEFGSMLPEGTIWSFLLGHGIYFAIFLLGAWFFCIKIRAGEEFK